MQKLFKINKYPSQFEDSGVFHKLAQQFLPYAQKRLKFDKPVGINLVSDHKNMKDPLGKTAYYDPNKMEITLFIDKRHVKDILRSLSHELVHHKQNCRGDFDRHVDTSAGYAQNDAHMRKCEGEAYLHGSGFLFRDWEDNLKKEKKVMAESKVNEEQSIWAPNHYCVHHGGVQMEGEIKLGKVLRHNWNEDLQKVTKYDMQFEDGTILENVKAEDIFVTEASLAEKHPGSDGGHGAMKVDEDDDDKEKKEELEEGEGKHKNPFEKTKKKKKEKHINPFEKTKEKKKQKQKHVNPFEESEKRPDSPDLDGDGDTEEPIAQAAKQADDGDDKEKNESWTRKNKDQLLFERLTKLWTK